MSDPVVEELASKELPSQPQQQQQQQQGEATTEAEPSAQDAERSADKIPPVLPATEPEPGPEELGAQVKEADNKTEQPEPSASAHQPHTDAEQQSSAIKPEPEQQEQQPERQQQEQEAHQEEQDSKASETIGTPAEAKAVAEQPQQSAAAPAPATAPAPASAPAPTPLVPAAPAAAQPKHSRSSLSSLNRGSAVFVISALESLQSAKDARRHKELKETAQRALEMIRAASASAPKAGAPQPQPSAAETVVDPRIIFEPLRLAIISRSPTLMTTSLDCIGKLISYGFFVEDTDPDSSSSGAGTDWQSNNADLETGSQSGQDAASMPLLDLVTSTICDAFDESVDEKAQLQIIKALLALVIGTSPGIHQSSLLKAVRTVYNIFLLSKSSSNQAVASGSLSQIVNAVFSAKQDELHIKDAFLVFRALCKLSMKPLTAESERDVKSQAMRSKLLSLQLILAIVKSHMSMFTDLNVLIHSASTGEDTPFIHAIKQYLCLSLSRNAVSSVNPVFEISCELFWQVLSGMRSRLKKEIEVLINEIFLPILEMQNSTPHQKSVLLGVLIRLTRDPQALVEIYLNYDCDRMALENIYERFMTIISKIASSPINLSNLSASEAPSTPVGNGPSSSRGGDGQLGGRRSIASSSTVSLPTSVSLDGGAFDSILANLYQQPVEIRMKQQSLLCLCATLRSLLTWANKGSIPAENGGGENGGAASSPRMSTDKRVSESGTEPTVAVDATSAGDSGPSHHQEAPSSIHTPDLSRIQTPDLQSQDDPSRFESAKLRKTTLLEGIRTFNYKPKRGIDFLVKHGFIRSRSPKDLARFLLYADGLNKAQIGEYLGEGETENIAIMHAFVDLMSFDRLSFVDALRRFLQAFRLPGEAQKIDRFMLKFAERYIAGNPGAFANADAAYVFAYSVIMLNTDAHNPQIKNRMTLQDFIKNNAGIDDGKSLPEEYVKSVYDEIQNNEIKMKDEIQVAPASTQSGTGLAGAIASVGRDLQREAYILQSEGMANKTEALFRTMVRAQRRIHPQERAAAEQYFLASHIEHVRPMFEVAWMSFLTGISAPLQDSDDADTVERCLEGFRDAIKIVCMFGLELERNAFVTTLAKFTFLNNLGEMKSKNIEAIKTLLGVAQTEGNYLKGSWREVLTCVSQLERFQLIGNGVDERQLPELGRRKPSIVSRSNTSRSSVSISSIAAATAASNASKAKQVLPDDEVVAAGASSEVTVAADMVFSSTPALSGTAIVDFVQALSDVSWEEIQSSGMTEHPRLFSLQKLVEISYYNMGRIRMEWSQIWTILGEHFNQVCCHHHAAVSAFGLDSLRQLAMRFLELRELPGFAFQREFLRPYEVTMRSNKDLDAQEMVLQCLTQMTQSRVQNFRSAWRAILSVLGAAARSQSERVAGLAFELLRQINTQHLAQIVQHSSFADLTVTLTEFAKGPHQKLALESVSLLTRLFAHLPPPVPTSPESSGSTTVTPSNSLPMLTT
ncbi:guanine nucleotide exchange protein for ADP-robosylation factor [Tilletia horrida]|nr:guanine nucleotide exchange protein for ADP-robosylation factor [Tilletia horrida]